MESRYGRRDERASQSKVADLVAVNPLKDTKELQKVKFVMKGGATFKNELRK
jgi:imidazolonepropionase-like amidohydrolase